MLHLCSGQELNIQEMAWYLFSFSLFLPRGRKSKSSRLCLCSSLNIHKCCEFTSAFMVIVLAFVHTSCKIPLSFWSNLYSSCWSFYFKNLADLKVGDGKNGVIFLISLPIAITCEFSCLLFCQRDLTTVLSWWEFKKMNSKRLLIILLL